MRAARRAAAPVSGCRGPVAAIFPSRRFNARASRFAPDPCCVLIGGSEQCYRSLARAVRRVPPDDVARPEALGESVDAEEQDPNREEQLDPRCDVDGQEEDQGDRVSGEPEPPRNEAGPEPDGCRRDREDRGHAHRVDMQDDGTDLAAEPRDFLGRSGSSGGVGEESPPSPHWPRRASRRTAARCPGTPWRRTGPRAGQSGRARPR
jgi:hypothetical protein